MQTHQRQEYWTYNYRLDNAAHRVRRSGPSHHGLTFTDPKGRITTFGYDHLNRLVSRTLPAPHQPGGPPLTEYKRYDHAGRILRERDFNGAITIYSYDARGRLGVRAHYANGSGLSVDHFDPIGQTPAITYLHSYLANVLLWKVEINEQGSSQRVVEYTYDQEWGWRLLSVSGPVALLSYEYFNQTSGRLKKTAAGQFITDFTYDPMGRIRTVGASGRGTYEYGYNKVGSGRTLTYAPATGSGDQHLYAERDYDALGRLTEVSHYHGISTAGQLLKRFTYSHRADGRRSGMHQNPGMPSERTVTYAYDALNRLTGESSTGSEAYSHQHTFDLVGNRLSKATGSGTISYVYDNNDRMTLENNGITGATHPFWVEGRGWTRADSPMPGDPLNTVGGTAAQWDGGSPAAGCGIFIATPLSGSW